MAHFRVVHYLNQFFAGVGGEERADRPVTFRNEVLGPGKRVQQLLGDSANIIGTVYCGDNYFAEHRDTVLASMIEIARNNNIQMLVAGPAFAAGRYGINCVEIGHWLSTQLGIQTITGMHSENPGVDIYRQYKDKNVYILPTAEDKGVKTVLITPEYGGVEGTELPYIFYVPEATAMVTTGSVDRQIELPSPERVIGVGEGYFVHQAGEPPVPAWGDMSLNTWASICGGLDWWGGMHYTLREHF